MKSNIKRSVHWGSSPVSSSPVPCSQVRAFSMKDRLMSFVQARRLVSLALLGIFASPLLAQPVITGLQPADGSLLSSRTGTLSGQAADATLLRVDGVELTLGAGGSFSYAFDLPEGESALSIYAEDAGGATSQVHHLEVDTLAPGIVVSSPAQTRVGASPVFVAGTVQEPHLQSVTVRGSPATFNGNSFSSSITLNEGAQNIAIVATDTLGHSSTLTLVLTLDTQAPAISVNESGAPFTGGLFDHPLTPQITISDVGTYTSEILLDGSPYVSGTPIGQEGSHQLAISATDAVGNTSSRDISFTLDFTAPVFGQITPAAGALIAQSTVTLQVEATGAASVKVGSLTGSAAGNLYTIGPITLVEGSQELVIEAFDAVGNRAERRHALLRDTTAPTLSIVSPAEGAVLTSSPAVVSGQALDPRLASVRVGGELASLSGSTFSISKALVEGGNSFLVEALDSVGNSATQTLNLTLDTTAPSFVVKVNGVVLAGGEVYSAAITPTLELSEPSATVTATLDGSSFTFGSAISVDGNHQLSVTVTHNSLSSSNLFSFRIDRQAPSFPSLEPAEGTVLAATSVLLEGRVQGAVSLTIDGVPVALQGEVFTAGPYTLSAGSRTFGLIATSAGGLQTTLSRTLVQDSVPPQLVVQQPAEGALLGSATTAVSGTATDPHLLRVRVSGVDAQVSASSFYASGVSLAEGSNTLTVVAEDRAGNQQQATRTVVRDTLDPEVAITDPVAGTVVPAASYVVRGTASDAHLDRVEVNGRRATLAAGDFSLSVSLAEGSNSIEAVAFDRLGHSKTTTVTISRDSAAPQITIQDPPEGFSTQAATLTVRGAYEDEPGTTVRVNGLVAVLTSGHFEVAGIELSPGENRITARATDAQGNEGVHTRTVVRDQVAPTFVRLEPAAGALALPLATVFTLTFSEEMAPPAEGAITLATTASGTQPAFTAVVQGKDLVLTPQALLPPETTLVLTLTAGLVDLAGNALSPLPAPFELTTVDTGAPVTPVLSAPPAAAACRHNVELTGTAEPLSQVRVQGGAAAALTRADEAGAFTLLVELLPEQLNVLHVVAIDALGNISPELVLELAADCTPPQVLGATLVGDTVSVTFSEAVAAPTSAFALISPSGPETFGFAASGATATLTLSAAPSGLLELAVGEGASTGVNDLASNAMAYPWHHLFGAGAGDSFLAGTVFDDGKGQPLRGVLVSVTATNGVSLGDPLPQQTTTDDGRFLLGLPVGTHDVTFARPGYAPVFRVVTTASGEGTHVFDPRLTLLNLPQAIGAAGGEVVAGAARLEVPALALASSQATSLTELSEQALPALLPYGYSPRGAVYVSIDASFAAPATLTLPIDTLIGREVVIASLDFALLQWKAIEVRTVNGQTLDIAISAPGAYVAVEADSESAAVLVPVLGQVLPSLPAPAGDEVTAADIDFAPTLVLPSQRSLATVSYTLANAGTPAPSGMPLTLEVQERLTLLDGSERRAVPYSADLLVFRSPAGNARSRFWLQPSPLAASLPIEIGAEDVSVRTFGATTVRGNILGPDGGSVLGVSGDVFEVPAGALNQPTAVVVTRRTVADLSHPAPAGFPVLGVIEVDLGGAQLAGIGSLTLATETPPTAGSRGILLGTVEVDGETRWRALVELEPVAAGWRTVSSGGSNPPWPGIRQGGLYLALELEGDWGLLEGALYDSDQNLVAGGLISSVSTPWIQLSGSNGSYVIALPAGAAVVVSARDLRYDQVAVEIPALTDGERRVFDLEVLPTGPTVIEIEPADGAANVPTTFLPRVRFSEPVDRSTLAAGIHLTRDGEPVAIELDHQGDEVIIDPVASLLPDTSYILEIGGAISDLQGRNLVATRSVSFRTQLGEPPVPGIDAGKLLLYEPDYQGLAKIIGLPGAVPADSTLWVESVETITVVAEANGSFELEIPATLGEDLFLTVLMPGQSAATRLLGPWLLRGDLGAWVGRSGARFKTAAGIEVEVQRDSFEQLTRVALELEAPPIATPSQLQILLDFKLDLGGATALKPIYIYLPAPANVPAGSTFLVSRFVEALGRRGWMAMDLLEIQGNTLTNAPFGNVQGSVVARAAGVLATRYENPLERVLSAENMANLRQGDYLPKASTQLDPDESSIAPRERLESAPARTVAQDIGLPGFKTGGHLQVAWAVAEVGWLALNRGITDLMVWVLTGEAAEFMAVTEHAGPAWLLVPLLKKLSPFEITVYDLTTGYQVYRQVQPPTPDPIFVLPPGNYVDNQPPSLVEGSPLRFALVQTAADGTVEILNGISATVLDESLTVTGQAGSTSPGTEVKLFDIDAEAGASGIQDEVVRSSDQGDFTLTIDNASPKRFLLAIGGVVGPSERLKLRFSKAVASVDGIELHKVDESGDVNQDATAVASSPLERGATWQLTPATGWRAGKYELWITDQFGGPEVTQFWKRNLTVELEVPKSSSVSSIPLTRFSDFDRMGNVLAIADNDGGLRLYDVTNPASPKTFLSGPNPYHFTAGGAIRGVAIENHGRVIAVGSGEQFAGQLHVLDPLVMNRQAPEATAWASGVWGYTSISNPLGTYYPFAKSGPPRSVAVMNNDLVHSWQVGSAAPEGITVDTTPIPGSDEKDLVLSGEDEVANRAISVRNLTRGRWSRVYVADDQSFSVGIKAREGDLLELRRSRNTWAYVSIDGQGIAMVDVEGTRGGVDSENQSLHLVEYTNGSHLEASGCDDSRPNVDSTPIDLDVVLTEASYGLVDGTLVTLVQGYGLALYQIDLSHPGHLSELSNVCAAVDNRALVAGMEVVANYPMDLDGDGRIREENGVSPEGEFVFREIRNYVVVAHSKGYLLIFDITNPAQPELVSRIKIGKSDEAVQISGVAVDRVNRKIYVGAFGRGLFAVDFNVLGGTDLQDSDNDQMDDRVVENIKVGTEEIVDALAFPELGIIWGGGRKTGAWSVAVGGPKLQLVAADGGPIREVSRLAPLGVPTAPESGKSGSPNYPAAFQAQVNLGSTSTELFVEVKSLGPGDHAIDSAGEEPGMPKIELVEGDAIQLDRQASNPWEEGSTLYLSKPVVTIADVRAAIAYQKTDDENEACPRCDQVAEHLYPSQPLPEDFLPELLSGHRISVNFRSDLLPGIRAVYGNLADGGISVPSVPWDISPAVKQEPAMNASTGMGDVPTGLLLHSGEFSYSEPDLEIPGVGFNFVFSRTYRSQTIGNGPLGPGWDHNWNIHVRPLPNGDIEFYDGRGRRDLVFSNDSAKYPQLKPGVALRPHSQGFTVTSQEGDQYQFDLFGRLLAVVDPLKTTNENGGTEARFTYDAASKLIGIESRGRRIHFEYDNGRLSKLSDFSNRDWNYFYDSGQRLVRVESPATNLGTGSSKHLTMNYKYVTSDGGAGLAQSLALRDDLDTINDPRGIQVLDLDFENVAEGVRTRVSRVKLGDSSKTIELTYLGARTSVKDRRDFTRHYDHDSFGHLTKYVDPSGNSTEWSFEDFEAGRRNGLIYEVKLPSGITTRYEHDEGGRTAPNLRTLSYLRKVTLVPKSQPPGMNGEDYGQDYHSACAWPRSHAEIVLLENDELHGLTGGPVQVTGATGQSVAINRDETGVAKEIRVENGGQPLVVTLETNGHGQPTKSTFEEVGSTNRTVSTSVEYDEVTGYLTRAEIESAGKKHTTDFERDERGNATRYRSSEGIDSSAKYNELGWLLEKCVGLTSGEACTRFQYDELGQPVRIEVPFGTGQHVATRIEYGPLGEVLEQHKEVQPGGPEIGTSFEYDDNLNLIEVDPTGRAKTSFTYDPSGWVKTVTETNSSGEPVVTTYEYDPDGQVTSESDGVRTLVTSYDEFGRKSKDVDVSKQLYTYYHFDAGGNLIHTATCHEPVAHSVERVAKSRFVYDLGGHLTEAVQLAAAPDGSLENLQTTFEYDNRGRVVARTDPAGQVQNFEYDELGRAIRISLPGIEGGEVQYRYPDGRTVEKTVTVGDRSVKTLVNYNSLGLPETVTNGLDQVTKYDYDDGGNLRQVTAPNEKVYFYSFDGLGRPLKITRPEDITETYSYDDEADSTKVTYRDAFDNATVSQYGPAGELLSTTYPGQTVTALTYDRFGNATKITYPGLEVDQTFDTSNRLISRVRVAGEGPAVNESFAWDALNRPTQSTVGGHTTAWHWDTASRLRQEIQDEYSLSYSPHPTSGPGAINYPSGLGVSRGYNAAGSLSTVAIDSSPLASFVQQGAGLASAQLGPLAGEFGYDAAGRVKHIRWNTNSRVVDETILRNSRGFPGFRTREDLAQSWAYTYDGAAELKTSQKEGAPSSFSGLFSYEYDAAQNLLKKQRTSACGETVTTFPPDASGWNRPSEASGTSLKWDTRGRLSGKGDLRFDYDDRNRLVGVRRQITTETSEVLASYSYDIEGRRVEREVGGTSTRTVWDDWQAVEDYRDGALVGQRVYGQGYDEILKLGLPLVAGGGLSDYHPVYDSLGNLTALVLPSGAIVERYDYGPYGERSVTANDNLPPKLEQVRLDAGKLWFQLSESSVKEPSISHLTLQNLSRVEQPILELQPVSTEGRQFGRQIAFRNGGDPAADPPNWPQPGDLVRLAVQEAALEDSFGNTSTEYNFAELNWPGQDGILVDNTPPRLEEICAQGSTLKLTFSEPVSGDLAGAALEIDGQPTTWQSENAGYTLSLPLSVGAHAIGLNTTPLDLAGLGFAQATSLSFVTNGTTKSIFAAPFPGEVEDSLVGNPYGFQGLPKDSETGFLYVRNRYYDPELGRFITPDPMGNFDSPNKYQFGLNNPIVNSDPTGEFVGTSVGTAVGGIIGLFGAFDHARLYDEEFSWNFVVQGALAGAAIGAGIDTLGAGAGVTATVLAGTSIGMGLGGAAASASSGGSYESFTRGALKGGILGALGAGAGLGLEAAGLSGGWMFAGSFAADTIAGTGIDSAFGDCGSPEECLASNAVGSLIGNGIGYGMRFRSNPCNCLVAGTPVATATGDVPVEEIKVGDEVWAQNQESGQAELAKVVGLFQKEAPGVIRLHLVEVDGKSDVLEITPQHPIFVLDRGWVKVGDLDVGDQILGMSGNPVGIERLEWRPGSVRVYNFEVEGLHNYFAGQVEVLVHNCGKKLFENLYPDELAEPTLIRKLSFDGEKWRAASRTGRLIKPNGRFNFVVQNGEVYITRQGIDGRGGHLDLARGARVEFAGEIRFGHDNSAGILKYWTNASGHFRPGVEYSHQAPLPQELFRGISH